MWKFVFTIKERIFSYETTHSFPRIGPLHADLGGSRLCPAHRGGRDSYRSALRFEMNITKHFDNENGFPYIAYESKNRGSLPALIIQLHGAGERGSRPEELDRVTVHGFSGIVTDDNLCDAVLIMPQCPTDSFWVAHIESLRRFIDRMIDQYRADPNRIYLCGLSMGGFGTWYTAMAYPDLFAAIAPCCGGGMAWNAGVLTMPIFAFHGLEDETVSPSQTMEMVRALEGKNKNLRYTFYEGVAHDSWRLAFSEELLAWLLSHHK